MQDTITRARPGPTMPAPLTLAAIEADPVAAIRLVRESVPDLTWQGFGRAVQWGGKPSFAEDREAMTSEWGVGQFVRAAQWLDQVPRTLLPSRKETSYGWKHVAERWHAAAARGSDCYIGNGMFLAAAYALGFMVRRIPDTPNAHLNISTGRRTLPRVWAP